MGKTCQVVVFGLRNEKVFIDLCKTEEEMKLLTLSDLRGMIALKTSMDASEHLVRLIFTQHNLEGDDTLLWDYGIRHLSVIQMVMILPGGLSA